MNALQKLLALSPAEKAELGVEATPAEIAQQPKLWRDTARRFADAAPAIRDLLAHIGLPGGPAEILFAGAGTSDFVGRCVEGPLSEALRTRVLACPTTDIVTHPEFAFPSDRPSLLVSIARSGNSPESCAAMALALRKPKQIRHLLITCSDVGALAQMGREHEDCSYLLALHPDTNDRGLAMTSSFTSMVIASLGLAYLNRVEEYLDLVERTAQAGECVLATAPNIAKSLARQNAGRAVFLGSGPLTGAATESALKLQELTAGKLVCLSDSFLGLRHGPRAALNESALAIYFLSNDPYVRKYEVDLIKGNREFRGRVGRAHLLVADRADGLPADLADRFVFHDPEGELRLPDHMLPPVVTMVGQLLGLFASLKHHFKPDTPSTTGVIHRVVEKFQIYPCPWGSK